MIGMLFFLLFMAIGIAITNVIFSEESILLRLWSGGVTGLVGIMFLPALFAFIFGFTPISNIVGLIAFLVIYIGIKFKIKTNGAFNFKFEPIDLVFMTVFVAIAVITILILNGHVLSPHEDGLYGGQSTYGDLSLHLGIITSIATQGKFPPDYSIYPGTLLSYPFLFDSLSSSLYLFGTPLRWAVLIPSYAASILLILGIYLFAHEILKSKIAASLSTLLFFINGGFGFIYVIDGVIKDPSNFMKQFEAWYNTPTNFNEHFVRWSNVICDMIVPQRTSMGGWTVVVFALWLLYKAVENKDKKFFMMAGIIAGTMPMIHTHSFLAFGMIAITWFIVYLLDQFDIKYFETILKWFLFSLTALIAIIPGVPSFLKYFIAFIIVALLIFILLYFIISKNKGKEIWSYVKNWLYFGVPVLIIALPQLIIWTFHQATGSGFTRTQSGWEANEGDAWIWFWIKNIGPLFIVMFPAIIDANKKFLKLFSGATFIYVIANLLLFQPNNYDNNKLLYIWYIFVIILTINYLRTLFIKLKGINGRWFMATLLIAVCLFSGALTIGREFASNDKVMQYDKNDEATAEFIKNNTPKDALFLTTDHHLNLVSALTGRNILAGTGLYLYFHGINPDERYNEEKLMYTDPTQFEALAAKDKIDYVFYSSYERSKYNVGPEYFINNYPTIYHIGEIYVFAISDRAKNYKP